MGSRGTSHGLHNLLLAAALQSWAVDGVVTPPALVVLRSLLPHFVWGGSLGLSSTLTEEVVAIEDIVGADGGRTHPDLGLAWDVPGALA